MSSNGKFKRAPMHLKGKVSVITGAASGIGEEIARVYADAGSKVAMIDFDKERLARISAEIEADGGEVLSIYADVTEEDTVRAAFKQVHDAWGQIDVVVNSAGRDSLAPPLDEVTLEEWSKTLAPNLTAVFLCCREAFIYMKPQGGGRIINVGSSSTRVASGPGHSPYRASKHGMIGFSKNILLDGEKMGIGVTVLNPSHVKTPMTEIIDKGLYDGDLKAYTDGWLDEKEKKEGIHASCIDVENVGWLALYIATRTKDVTIPTISLYPTHKVHRYGMEV